MRHSSQYQLLALPRAFSGVRCRMNTKYRCQLPHCRTTWNIAPSLITDPGAWALQRQSLGALPRGESENFTG